MIQLYDPLSSGACYKDYYQRQSGNGLAVFKGSTIQRGHGIGGFFSGLLKGAMPLLKSGAKTVGKQLLKTGLNITGDLLNGKNFKESAKQRFSQSGQKLVQNFSNMLVPRPPTLQPQSSRKRKYKSPRQHKKQSTSTKLDIFKKPRKP